MSFARPWWLLLLLLLPFFVAARRRWRRWRRPAVPYPPLQYSRGPAWRRRLAAWMLPLEAVLLAVMVIGAAGPERVSKVELLGAPGIDVALVLDVSLSMKADDFPPNRLEVLRGIARDFVERSGPNRFALLIFAGDVFVQAPMTTDRRAVLELIDGMSFESLSQGVEEIGGSGGTAIGDALLAAAEKLAAARLPERDQALILLTDGDNTTGIDPRLAARFVARQDLSVSFIGIGREEPIAVHIEGNSEPYMAKLDADALAEIAELAGGRFYRATDAGALAEVFAELARLESAPLEPREVEIRGSWAPAVAVLALLLYVLHLFLSGYAVARPLR